MLNTSTAGDILANILSEDISSIIFLHNTRNEEIARCILKKGFQFEEQLAYSADRVNAGDAVEINYFLVERKEYGKYTIIIEIDKELFRKYNYLAERSDMHLEDLITVTAPELSDNDEYIYTLAHYYIKGYLDNNTGKFYENKEFNPSWESPLYIENYNRLKGQEGL